MVMDFMDGADLYGRIIKPRLPLKREGLQLIMAQVMIALEYMHSLDVIHRDMKSDSKGLELDL